MIAPRETSLTLEKMLFVGGVLDGRWIEVDAGVREWVAVKHGGDGFIYRDVYERTMLEQYVGDPPVRHYVHFFRLRGTLETDAVRRLMEFYRPEKPT